MATRRSPPIPERPRRGRGDSDEPVGARTHPVLEHNRNQKSRGIDPIRRCLLLALQLYRLLPVDMLDRVETGQEGPEPARPGNREIQVSGACAHSPSSLRRSAAAQRDIRNYDPLFWVADASLTHRFHGGIEYGFWVFRRTDNHLVDQRIGIGTKQAMIRIVDQWNLINLLRYGIHCNDLSGDDWGSAPDALLRRSDVRALRRTAVRFLNLCLECSRGRLMVLVHTKALSGSQTPSKAWRRQPFGPRGVSMPGAMKPIPPEPIASCLRFSWIFS
jgi:hypothetical protein